jgi:hypothetical protein
LNCGNRGDVSTCSRSIPIRLWDIGEEDRRDPVLCIARIAPSDEETRVAKTSLRSPATVQGEGTAGNVGGGVGAEEDRKRRYILNRREAT